LDETREEACPVKYAYLFYFIIYLFLNNFAHFCNNLIKFQSAHNITHDFRRHRGTESPWDYL